MSLMELTQLLVDLTQQARPLLHTESLEDYQKQSNTVCQSCQLSPQQLGTVRGQLQALSSEKWLELADDGVIAADVSK